MPAYLQKREFFGRVNCIQRCCVIAYISRTESLHV